MDHDHPFCGGVAISPWNVLTAAHCLFPEKVRFLSSNLQGGLQCTTVRINELSSALPVLTCHQNMPTSKFSPIFQDSDDLYVPYKASDVGIRLGDVTLKTAKEGKLYRDACA